MRMHGQLLQQTTVCRPAARSVLAGRASSCPVLTDALALQTGILQVSLGNACAQDFLEEVQGLFDSVGSLGSRAGRLVPAGAVSSLSSRLSSTAQDLTPSGAADAAPVSPAAVDADMKSEEQSSSSAGMPMEEAGEEVPRESERGEKAAGQQSAEPVTVKNNA